MIIRETFMFHVAGEPRPQPKENHRVGSRSVYYRDPKGHFKIWRDIVRLAATEAMFDYDIIPRAVAIRLGVAVWMTKAKSNKKKYPTQIPDWSNFWYFAENILKGIVYDDDCQVLGPLPGDKQWVSEDRSPGMLITVQRVEPLQELPLC